MYVYMYVNCIIEVKNLGVMVSSMASPTTEARIVNWRHYNIMSTKEEIQEMKQ